MVSRSCPKAVGTDISEQSSRVTMYARLVAKSGLVAGKTYEIVAEAVIGHGPECNLLIKSGILSAKHARIYFDQKKGSYFLEDFKSYNGTHLDGKPVQGKVKLDKKHIIMFANTYTFLFQTEHGQANDPLPPPPKDLPPEPEPLPRRRPQAAQPHEAPPAAVSPPAPPSPKGRGPLGFDEGSVKHPTVLDDGLEAAPDLIPPMEEAPPRPPAPQSRDAAPTMLIDEMQLAELLDARPRFMLEFKNVRGEKSTIDLKEGENTVGRIAGSDIAVDDASISRNHAVITVRSGKVLLKDLASKNGTFVADKKIAGEFEVEPDTPIRFGLVKATIVRKPEKSA
ncbi:MAG: FHA domain-containing protein [Bacteroidota bacterium]